LRAIAVEELKSVEQIVLQKIEGLARKLVGHVKDAGLDPDIGVFISVLRLRRGVSAGSEF